MRKENNYFEGYRKHEIIYLCTPLKRYRFMAVGSSFCAKEPANYLLLSGLQKLQSERNFQLNKD